MGQGTEKTKADEQGVDWGVCERISMLENGQERFPGKRKSVRSTIWMMSGCNSGGPPQRSVRNQLRPKSSPRSFLVRDASLVALDSAGLQKEKTTSSRGMSSRAFPVSPFPNQKIQSQEFHRMACIQIFGPTTWKEPKMLEMQPSVRQGKALVKGSSLFGSPEADTDGEL